MLDIGSNNGFVSIYCARYSKTVTGIEYNNHLIQIANDVSKYLKVNNLNFLNKDFSDIQINKKFDIVLSLSNHHTIDNELNIGFDNYIKKIFDLLKPNGYLLFESHNVFGPGAGGVGDDGDMERKIEIMTDYFQIIRYRMIRRFSKYNDVDKLFIVAKKANQKSKIKFNLLKAQKNYDWTWPNTI